MRARDEDNVPAKKFFQHFLLLLRSFKSLAKEVEEFTKNLKDEFLGKIYAHRLRLEKSSMVGRLAGGYYGKVGMCGRNILVNLKLV